MVNNREARASAETISIPADGARWSASVPNDVEYATKVRPHRMDVSHCRCIAVSASQHCWPSHA